MHASRYKDITSSDENWICDTCKPVQPNGSQIPVQGRNLKWGDMHTSVDINNTISKIYEKVTTWKMNLFDVPRGKAGKDFITEITRLLSLFNNRTQWESLALNILMIFPPLMLQKPSSRSKNKDHSRYLHKRLLLWKEGKLQEIISEVEEIQRRISKSTRKKEESTTRGFTRLMMEGKVKQALRLVDSDNVITGVHEMSEEIKRALQAKHPEGKEASPEVLAGGDIPRH